MSWSSEVLADSPLAWWRLGEASGTAMVDSSGNGRDGVYTGGITLNQTSLVASDTSNTAADMDTTVQGNVTDAAWMDVSTVTLECWYKPDTAPGAEEILVNRYSSTTNQRTWLLRRSAAGKLALYYYDTGGTQRVTTGATTLAQNVNHHLAATVDGSGNVVLYVDGVSDATASYGVAPRSAVATNIRVGSYNGGGSLTGANGILDEVAFYGSVLSGARILAHYNAGAGLGAFSGSAALAATGTIAAAGVVGRSTGASLAATGTITAAGVVGKVAGAALSATATITAAGDALAANEGSAVLAATGIIAAAGVVGTSTGAAIAATDTITATGAVGVAAGASLAATATISAAGLVSSGAAAGAAIAATVTITAAGVVARVDIPTDTSNIDDGINIDGSATVTWEPDVVEPPFFVGPLTEDQVRIAARCIDTAPGALPSFTPAVARQVYAPAARDRVLIGGVDMTYWNGATVQVENMKLIDPLLYGGCRITLPGINPQFPDAVLGDLFERFRFARVKVQRVLDGVVIATDSKGFVSRIDTSGTTLSLEVGGEAAGALSQMYVPPPVFRRKQDVEHIVADTLRDARVRAKEHDGTSGLGLIRRGGSDGLTIVNETIAVWSGAVGQAVTWTPNADGVYRKTQKSDEIVATAYIDSSLVSQDLHQDFAEQWTRVYAQGFTAAGEIVTNIKTPGLTQGLPLDFEGPFGLGDTDGTTNTSVTPLQQHLQIHNWLDFNDTTPGTFDEETRDAVMFFQAWAGLGVTGIVNEATWGELFDLSAIGYSLDEARQYPMAQDTRTVKWHRTANGSKIAENPDYDPHFIPNDLAIDVGGPFGRRQIRDFAASKLTPDDGVWTGTLTFRSGLIWGDHSPGDPLDAGDVMDRRDLLPNMRIKLPYFAGGISVYVAGVDHGPEETQCLVSTVPATTMETWQAIERRREAKSNPGRSWSGHTRASQVRNDVAVQWDTSSGWIANYVDLNEDAWTEIKVPAGQAGIVQRIRAELYSAKEFACLLTQKPVSLEALNNNPHTSTPLVDPRPDTRPWFEIESVVEWLENRGLLGAWGTEAQPCGYDPSRKTDERGATAEPITGLFVENAGFNYETGSEPVLYLYIWQGHAGNYLMPGRILRNQRTTDF
jgi:peptidoglycan hydrolase-like protein with peptidoglycan-binding domain